MNEQNVEVGRNNPAPGVRVPLGRPNFVLLTVTTEDRKPWLTNPEAHCFLHDTRITATAWLVVDYLLMPDHLHAFCAARDLSFTIEQGITFWERDFRRLHGHEEWRFQPRGWHHRLRQDVECSTKWLYVQENPVRKGLVKNIVDWHYKGTVHPIKW